MKYSLYKITCTTIETVDRVVRHFVVVYCKYSDGKQSGTFLYFN